MTFLAPLWLWLLAAIPLVILLHFLRTRRRAATVSALFLWERATEAAAARRRFALWWLLLLQILVIILAALGLARPLLAGQGAPDRILVVDTSASMSARDSEGVRIDRARELARDLVSGGGRVGLVEAGSTATVLVPPTDDRAQLQRALDALQAVAPGSALEDAIALAASMTDGGEIHVLTDEAPEPEGYLLHQLAGDGENIGLTGLDILMNQVFVTVTSTYRQPQLVTVSLFRDGRPAGSTELLVPMAGQASATLILPEGSGFLEASLTVPASDALALDDSAWAGSRSLNVWSDGSSEAVDRAVAAVGQVNASVPRAAADALLVQLQPGNAVPAGNVLAWPPRSPAPQWLPVRDWDQSHPLLRFVDLRDAQAGLDPQAPEEPLEGFTVIARAADFRPLIQVREDASGTQVVLSFNPAQSDLILRPAFPALIANVTAAFRSGSSLELGAELPAGSFLDSVPVPAALVPGVYQLPDGPASVSLLSAGETRLPLPAELPVTAQETGAEPGDLELYRYALLLVPLLLAAEWLIYSRRTVA